MDQGGQTTDAQKGEAANGGDQVDGDRSKGNEDDDAECGSSDIGSELIVQSFADIRSFSVVRIVVTQEYVDLSNVCLFPNGDVIFVRENGVTVRDMKMNIKVHIYSQNLSEPKHTAIVDNRTFAVSIPTRKYLQLIYVAPFVKMGRGILRRACLLQEALLCIHQ